MTTRKILVTGATGQQGGAVIKALLANPPSFKYQILALTRNTSSPAAKELATRSQVTLLSGDLDHCPAIFEKAGGPGSIWGVFLVTVPDTKVSGNSADNKERVQGCAMIDAVVANDVKHFVFSSVDRGGPGRSDENPTEIDHFITKHYIEKYLREKAAGTEMTWTMLRPVAFMDNMKPGMFCKMFGAMWLGMGNEVKLQIVGTKDIGVFAAKAFGDSDGQKFKNQAITLVGDDLTQPEASEVFWKVFARPMPRTYGALGSVLMYMVKEVGVMFKWFKDEGYGGSVEECKSINPDMQDLETWLREESGFTSWRRNW